MSNVNDQFLQSQIFRIFSCYTITTLFYAPEYIPMFFLSMYTLADFVYFDIFDSKTLEDEPHVICMFIRFLFCRLAAYKLGSYKIRIRWYIFNKTVHTTTFRPINIIEDRVILLPWSYVTIQEIRVKWYKNIKFHIMII